MRLTGKTRDELSAALADKSRAELLELIFSLVTLERWVSATEIAEASKMSRRDVLAAMKAGKFGDAISGPGFFRRGSNSLRVSVSAANAWRRSFFVSVSPMDSIPPLKKREAQPKLHGDPPQTDLNGQNFRQKRATIRALSPSFLGS